MHSPGIIEIVLCLPFDLVYNRTLNFPIIFFRCEEFRNCVLCKIYNIGTYSKQSCETFCGYNITVVDELAKDDPTKKQCRVPDTGTCIVLYEYFYQKEDVIVRVLKGKFCPKPVNIIGNDISIFIFLFIENQNKYL